MAFWDYSLLGNKSLVRTKFRVAYVLYGLQQICVCVRGVIYRYLNGPNVDPSDRAVKGVGLRPLSCCDCGFESHRGHGCVSVVCCQVEISASGWSLVQRSPTECGVSECNHESSTMRRPSATKGCWVMVKKKALVNLLIIKLLFNKLTPACFGLPNATERIWTVSAN